MAKLKAAVRTIGDHKQRITINVSLEGIKIIDEKTEVSAIYFYFNRRKVLNFLIPCQIIWCHLVPNQLK